MNLYIIIGEQNTRKSSIVRCLTGCFNQNDREIKLINGNIITVFARVSSLQEAEISPTDFINNISPATTNVLLCLWESANQKDVVHFPNAISYINSFTSNRWIVLKTVLLGSNNGKVSYPNNLHLPNSSIEPVNQSANDIRKHFGWL